MLYRLIFPWICSIRDACKDSFFSSPSKTRHISLLNQFPPSLLSVVATDGILEKAGQLATTQEKWDLCAWNILHSTTTGPRTHRKLRDSFSSLKENWHKISDISPPTLILLLLCMPTFGNCLPLPGIRPLVSRTIHGFYPCHSIFAKLLIFLFPMICFK